MKLFSKTFFFCFFAVLCLKFLDASKDSVILDGNNYDQVDGLLSFDGSVQATQKYKDIKLSGYGRINLTLDDGELIFEVCSTCAAKSKVCFETPETRIQTELECSEVPSYCTFEVHKEGEKIFFGDAPVYKEDFQGSCLYPKIHSGAVQVVGIIKFDSCEPKIVDKMIKLYVSIDPSCPITVKNAKILAPPTTSTTKVPPTNKSPPNDSAEASSFPDWGYIILAVGIIVLIVILVIGFIAYHLYKTHQPLKHIPPNIDEIKSKPTVSNAKVAIVETPTNQNLKLEKVEPNMNNENKSKKNQKKDKKKKTKIQEPTTSEDIPTISQQESVASISSKQLSPLPPPNPAACYPVVNRIIPRSVKSAKNDSLNEKDKSVMMESESVKF